MRHESQSLLESAAFVGFSPEESKAIAAAAAGIPAIANSLAGPGTEPASAATVSLAYLVVALRQVEVARSRHRAEGVSDEMSRATLSDLSLRARSLRHFGAPLGLTWGDYEWAQTYLSGSLLRIGSLQYELSAFTYPIRVFRLAETGRLLAASLRDGEPAFDFDLAMGSPSSRPWRALDERWEVVLEPGTPMLRLHIPADADLSIAGMTSSLAAAFDHFGARDPVCAPRGIFGESWLFDHAIRACVRNVGVRALIRHCSYYPSDIPELKTIRRVFGPEAERNVLGRLERAGLSSLQRHIVDLLADDSCELRALGGFILTDGLERLAHEH